LINFENLKLAGTPIKETGNHYFSVRYPSRQLQLYMHGQVVSAPEQAPVEYGGLWSFLFQPAAEDVPNLVRLEELLTDEKGLEYVQDYNVDLAKYEFRPFLNDDSLARIKLRADENGWKFLVNSEMTEQTLAADLKKGTSITITVAPGFYFSDESERYGLYLTLKEIKFPDAAETPMRKTFRKPLKSVSKK
jgi:hypothetical protein